MSVTVQVELSDHVHKCAREFAQVHAGGDVGAWLADLALSYCRPEQFELKYATKKEPTHGEAIQSE